jgi:hypothetical protein
MFRYSILSGYPHDPQRIRKSWCAPGPEGHAAQVKSVHSLEIPLLELPRFERQVSPGRRTITDSERLSKRALIGK